jgi:hypothetical protein
LYFGMRYAGFWLSVLRPSPLVSQPIPGERWVAQLPARAMMADWGNAYQSAPQPTYLNSS